eukprot:g4136.t1
MDKKTNSKAMQAILSRMPSKDFTLEYYGNHRMSYVPVSEWPPCDVLICKRSSEMSMSKVLRFIERYKPLLINDVFTQSQCLADRRRVYETLQSAGIPVPNYVVMDRDGPESSWSKLEEFEDFIVVDDVRVDKPFVEKPVSGDDHNIYIYYPSASGGGSKRMFRKRKDRSSQFYPDVSTVRRQGSYIYEHFMHTNGSDVKVYTVGPAYAHAEARKAPTLDGIVVRDENGKERRFPVRLNSTEKMYARRIVHAFKQNVCGFDILRTDHVSYVCDVNGWSLVKNSPKYWSDCAHILTEIMLKTLDPPRLELAGARGGGERRHRQCRRGGDPPGVVDDDEMARMASTDSTTTLSAFTPASSAGGDDGADPTTHSTGETAKTATSFTSFVVPGSSSSAKDGNVHDATHVVAPTVCAKRPALAVHHRAELRCVVAVFRHGDRTPKQKMKMKTSHPSILNLYTKYCMKKFGKKRGAGIGRGDNTVYAGSPSLNAETSVTTTPAQKLTEADDEGHHSIFEKEVLLRTATELQDVLDMVRALLQNVRVGEDESDGSESELPVAKLTQLKSVLEMYGGFRGINRKVQLKPKKWYRDKKSGVKEVLLVLKWGGALTKAGQIQAGHIGKAFRRTMYPTNDVLGLGLLRLHSTFRHDLKIYSSDEGRCLMTAAAFAKDFLDLEGELPPILTSLVRTAPNMLNKIPDAARETLNEIKTKVHANLSKSTSVGDDFVSAVAPTKDRELVESIEELSPNPRTRLYRLWELISKLTEMLRQLLRDQSASQQTTAATVPVRMKSDLYNKETLLLMYTRWKKLHRDLYHKRKDRFDMSKVPDVYDTAVYDKLHNQIFFSKRPGLNSILNELYSHATSFASVVIPQEYGVTAEDKLKVASSVADNLFHKIHSDLETASKPEDDEENGDTRLDAEFIEVSENVPFIKTPRRHIRTRIYITSESHIHSLVNALKFATGKSHTKPLVSSKKKRDYLGRHMVHKYCSHIVMRLWELPHYPLSDPRHWRIDLCYGPGAMTPPTKPYSRHSTPNAPTRSHSPVQEYGGGIEPLRSLNESLTLEHVQDVLSECGSRGAKINRRLARSAPKRSVGSSLDLARWGGRLTKLA